MRRRWGCAALRRAEAWRLQPPGPVWPAPAAHACEPLHAVMCGTESAPLTLLPMPDPAETGCADAARTRRAAASPTRRSRCARPLPLSCLALAPFCLLFDLMFVVTALRSCLACETPAWPWSALASIANCPATHTLTSLLPPPHDLPPCSCPTRCHGPRAPSPSPQQRRLSMERPARRARLPRGRRPSPHPMPRQRQRRREWSALWQPARVAPGAARSNW